MLYSIMLYKEVRMDMRAEGVAQVALRLPHSWREVIKAEAGKNHRSMNSEIICAIETAMKIKGVSLEQATA